MTTRSTECSLFSHAPVLTPPLLSRIKQLNLEYLQLLLDVSVSGPVPGPCAHADALPLPLLHSLRKLSPSALSNVAGAPYALYTLGFDDQEFWLTNLGAMSETCLRVADEPITGCRLPRHAAFCEAVIFFAWHLAVASPLAARVMCGIPSAVSECLQSASFCQLQSVIRTCPWQLMPRWPANPQFWPDLLRLAAAGDTQALRGIHLLGNQLIACDLRLAESPPPQWSGRVRAARNAQQERWKLRTRC